MENPFVGVSHTAQIFTDGRIRFCRFHSADFGDGALDPVDDAQQNIFLRIVKLQGFVILCLSLIAAHFLQKTVPAQIQANLVIAAEMVHFPDARNDGVFLNCGL